MEEWGEQIDKALAFDVEHFSAYCLTFEAKTKLQKDVDLGKVKMVDEELQSDQFVLLRKKLMEHGFQHYEISNFAIEGSTVSTILIIGRMRNSWG